MKKTRFSLAAAGLVVAMGLAGQAQASWFSTLR